MEIRLTKDEWLDWADSKQDELDLAGLDNWGDEDPEAQLEGCVWAMLDDIALNLYAGQNTAYDFDEDQVLKFTKYQSQPFDLVDIVGYFRGCSFKEVGINYPDKVLTIYA